MFDQNVYSKVLLNFNVAKKKKNEKIEDNDIFFVHGVFRKMLVYVAQK